MKLLYGILMSLAIHTWYTVQLTEGAKRETKSYPYEIYYRWKQMDYNYDCAPITRKELIKHKKYIPENVIMTSVKISGNRMFLNTPRFLPGVPVTISWLPYGKQLPDSCGPLLNPYPSWEMQEMGNCDAIQSVIATEIDQWNRLWIIDIGRLDIFGPTPINKCPSKIVVIDLNKDKVIYTYIFPPDVVSRTNGFPRDVTVACKNPEDCILYICDFFGNRLIMYDHYRKRSWYVTHPTMKPDPNAVNITIQGVVYPSPYGISGIGLSPRSTNHDTFYYSALAGFTIYKVSTRVLQSASCGSTLNDKDVSKVIKKPSQSDGMTMDAKGNLYFGSLMGNALQTLNTTLPPKERRIAQSEVDFTWEDTFAFDNENGFLCLVTDRFQNFGAYDLSDYNFRVLRFNIDTQSYIY